MLKSQTAYSERLDRLLGKRSESDFGERARKHYGIMNIAERDYPALRV